jgi:predicted DNA-binding transcriptional regulator YafY
VGAFSQQTNLGQPDLGQEAAARMNRTDRLMGIVLELQARGELRAEDLAGTFEVSVRTIYRDVEALCETGVPVVATPGKGYRLMHGYFLPPLSFTADEAALLLLGGELVRDRVDPLLRTSAEEALRKLGSVLPPERRAEMERRRQGIYFASPVGPSDDRRLVLARRAIEDRRVVRLLYHAFLRDEPEPRDVEPLRLVHIGQTWHLAGYCRLRQGARLFRLDRIDRLEVLAERYTLGPRHALTARETRDITVFPEARVRFEPQMLRWVRERQPFTLLREEPGADAPGSDRPGVDASGSDTPGSDTSGSERDGWPVFVYALRDERELLTWLLTWGRGVEVLSPESLRASLADEARAMLARHAAPLAEEARLAASPVHAPHPLPAGPVPAT